MIEGIIAIILLTFGTTLGAIILWKFFDIVRNSINKNKKGYDEDRFDKLAKAFIHHRKDTDKRLENIEAMLIDSRSEAGKPIVENYNSGSGTDSIKFDSNSGSNTGNQSNNKNLQTKRRIE